MAKEKKNVIVDELADDFNDLQISAAEHVATQAFLLPFLNGHKVLVNDARYLLHSDRPKSNKIGWFGVMRNNVNLPEGCIADNTA
jgi:hypothetical protein